MTEAEWVSCTDPDRMLAFRRGQASERRLRLFACASCRPVWSLLNEEGRSAVEVAERYADGAVDDRQLRAAYAAAGGRFGLGSLPPDSEAGAELARLAATPTNLSFSEGVVWVPYLLAGATRCYAFVRVVASGGRRLPPGQKEAAAASQVALLRCVFGNPFRPVTLDPAWLTPDVQALAHAGYEERKLPQGTLDPARLAVLADALEEVGCRDGQALQHLRGPGPHVRGCWVVDLLLGKG